MLKPSELKRRYEQAHARVQGDWNSNLQKVYNYVFPNRADFNVSNRMPGQQRSQHVYDPSMPLAIKQYAAKIVHLIFGGESPIKIVPGDLVKSGKARVTLDQASKDCQKFTDLFFSLLNKSNFQHAIQQSTMEMAISTGVLQVCATGDINDPFIFKSVPLHQVALEPCAHGSVKTVYRKYKMPAQVIQETWPQGNLSKSLLRRIEKNPMEDVELLESTVYQPKAPRNKAYCYSVMEVDSNDYIHYEEKSYTNWIVFRENVLADEVYGRGVAFDLLPFIAQLNLCAEYSMQSFAINALPIYLVTTGSELNAHTMQMKPGSLIPVQPSGMNPPISQLPANSSAQGLLEYRQMIKSEVDQYMGSNPLGSVDQKDKMSATEAGLRDQMDLESKRSMYNRLDKELVRSLFNTCWAIMHETGLVPNIPIDGQIMDIEYNTPVLAMNKQIKITKLKQAAQTVGEVMGPELGTAGVVYGLNITDVPEFVCENIGVDANIQNNALGKQKLMQAVQNMAQQQSPQQQLFNQPTGATNPSPLQEMASQQ